MAIKNIQIGQVGTEGVVPQTDRIDTDDTAAAVVVAGYLNSAVKRGFSFSNGDFVLVSTRATPSSAPVAGTYTVSIVGADTSLVVTA